MIPVKNSYEMKCGHDLPSNELTSYLAKSPYEMRYNTLIYIITNLEIEVLNV